MLRRPGRDADDVLDVRAEPAGGAIAQDGPPDREEVVFLCEDRRNRRVNHWRRWLFRGVDELRRQQQADQKPPPPDDHHLDCSL